MQTDHNRFLQRPIKWNLPFVDMLFKGIYPPSESADYDESYAGAPNDFLTKFVAEWEDSAQLPPDSKTRLAVVRIGE